MPSSAPRRRVRSWTRALRTVLNTLARVFAAGLMAFAPPRPKPPRHEDPIAWIARNDAREALE